MNNEVIETMIKKVDNIKENLLRVRDVKENDKITNEYIEKLSVFSSELNNLESISNDLYDEYIIQKSEDNLSNEERNKQKKLLIDKKIQKMLLPYMLYLQVALENSN